ncbi:hypothetical protein CsatB_016491 [Cannabis sativa]
MPESRDRLSRPVDVAGIFTQRRSNSFGVLVDEPVVARTLIGSPPMLQTTTATPTTAAVLGTPVGFGAAREDGGGVRRESLVSPRAGTWRRESTPMSGTARRGWGRGRGRNRTTQLPSWYPRTPLRDVTAITRAIERRRALLRESGSGLEMGSPTAQDLGVFASPSAAPLEQNRNDAATSPYTAVRSTKLFPPSVSSVGKVPKILRGIANQTTGDDSDCLTPQKKLLNSIDKVEKVVMEELQKLRRTPTAKRAEREKRVRTLMTMR